MNLVVDVGNTKVKAAVFKENTLLESYTFNPQKIVSEIKKIIKKYAVIKGIISSVNSISDKNLEKLQQLVPFFILSDTVKIPFYNLYATPKTLGVDRIALATAGVKKYIAKNILIIDAGTCITYDFINEKREYLGGAISPGVSMRYQSLHTFTSKLPLLKKNQPINWIGNSTQESMHSGIINGLCLEIEGTILHYQKKYPNLTVVLTGGDLNFLAKQLKSSIFAHSNFLLYGLNELLIFNQDE